MVSNMVSSSNKSLTLPMYRMILELDPPPCVGQVGCMRCIYTVSYTDRVLSCKQLYGVNSLSSTITKVVVY